MKKQVKKTTKKTVLKKDTKAVSSFGKKKKENNNSIKVAFYIIFVIVVLLILYFVNFKKPKNANSTNDEVVISEMLNGDKVANDSSNGHSLKLPSSFKVFKQGNANSSGPATILSVLSYFGKDAIFNEEIIEDLKSEHEPFHKGTCINQIKEMLTTLKFKFYDDSNYKNIPELKNEKPGIKIIENSIKAGYPVIVGWNKIPGHWSFVVGYESSTSGNSNDDIIIMADPDNATKVSNVKVKDFEGKWDFGDFFKGEPSADEKAKNCFIIIDKNN